MATRAKTRIDLPARGSAEMWEWTGLTFSSTDDGAPVILPAGTDRSVHAIGTFGASGAITIEGTNETSATPTNWVALHDNFGAALTLLTGTAALKGVHEAVYQIRPRVTAGDGTTNLTVRLIGLGG